MHMLNLQIVHLDMERQYALHQLRLSRFGNYDSLCFHFAYGKRRKAALMMAVAHYCLVINQIDG